MRTTKLRRTDKEHDLQRIRSMAGANAVAAFYAKVIDKHGVEALHPRPLLDSSGRPKIELTFKAIECHWGKVATYLVEACGITRAGIEMLRDKYLEPT
jgi:hypothetical protein